MVKLLHRSADTCLDPATGSCTYPMNGKVHKNRLFRQIHSRHCAKGYEAVTMGSNFW